MMKKLFILLAVGFIFAVGSCENQITTSEHNNSSPSKLLPIPSQGSVPLPETSDADSTAPPAFTLLHQYVQEHPDHPYIAVAGIWKPSSQEYTYKALTLNFSVKMQKGNNEKMGYYHYQMIDTSGVVLQSLAALIPPTQEAQERMNKWLEIENKALVVGTFGSESKDSRQDSTSLGDDVIADAPSECPVALCGKMGTIVVTAPSGDGVVDGGGVADGGGSTGDGDGGRGPHGGGGTNGNDDSSDDQDNDNQTEPCKTNGNHPALEDSTVQQAMDKIWNESYGSSNNGLDDSKKNEAMFMVLATQGGYKTEKIPAGPKTSSCHFQAENISIPSNVVALIHTHPYSDGDTINDPRCNSSIYDGHNVSSGDKNLMQKFNSVGYNIPFYVMDKDKIHILQPSDPSQYSNTINRCGY